MNVTEKMKAGLVAAGLLLAWGIAGAVPVTYLGYDSRDQSANGTIPIGSAFSTQRATFEGLLTDISKSTFGTTASVAAPLLPLGNFAGGSTITQSNLLVSVPGSGTVNAGLRGSVRDVRDAQFQGRFNTTGFSAGNQQPAGAWWETDGVFSLNLGSAYNAFGFDATDFGDFDGTLSMTLYLGGTLLSMDGTVQSQLLTLRRPLGSTVANGSVLFFGFVSEINFDRIDFSIAQLDPSATNTYDRIGFDQMTVGRFGAPPNNVPEPGTLALVALSLGALAAARRRHS